VIGRNRPVAVCTERISATLHAVDRIVAIDLPSANGNAQTPSERLTQQNAFRSRAATDG